MTKIATSILQKVKDELELNEDLPSTDLYDLLHKHRSNNHPDKFTNDEIKKEAEEKFKELNILLKELQIFIEKENFEKKPSELIVYEKDFELIKLKQEIISLEEKNNSETAFDDTTIEKSASAFKREKVSGIDVVSVKTSAKDFVTVAASISLGNYASETKNDVIPALTASMLSKGTTLNDKFKFSEKLQRERF